MHDRHRAGKLRDAMFAWIKPAQDARGGLPKVQLDGMHKIAEMQFKDLAMCILVEAASKERNHM